MPLIDMQPDAGRSSASSGWLTAARQRSQDLLETVASGTADVASHFVCVAAAGSLGRLEAGPAADIDTLFIVETEAAVGDAAVGVAVETFFGRLTGLPLAVPKAHGIFRRPVARSALLAVESRGRIDESPHTFGPRIQMLLDARPIHGAAAFAELRRAILAWYAPRPWLTSDAPWSYLLSDLVRYAHAYRNWQRFAFDNDDADSWSLRQAKLQSCRFMTWLGLYAVLLRAREESDREAGDWLADHLDLTPIERVAVVCREDAPGLATEIMEIYEAMLAHLAEPAVRIALVRAAGPSPGDSTWEPGEPLQHVVRLAAVLRGRVATWLAIRQHRLGPAEALPF